MRIYIPTKSPSDWKTLLAGPDKHWKTGHSAKALAFCWEEAKDFPSNIRKVFSEAPYPAQKKLYSLAANSRVSDATPTWLAAVTGISPV